MDDQRFADPHSGEELEVGTKHSKSGKALLTKMLETASLADARKRANIWDPGVYYRNCIRQDATETWYTVFTDETAKKFNKFVVCMRMRCVGRFVERFELQKFPFDTQTLEFIVGCEVETAVETADDAADPKKILEDRGKITVKKIVQNPKYTSVVNISRYAFPLNAEYQLGEPVQYFDNKKTKESESSSSVIYPYMILQLRLQRHPGSCASARHPFSNHHCFALLPCSEECAHFSRPVPPDIKDVFMPIFAITSFASATLIADAETIITDRLSATFVCVLSIVGFQSTIAEFVAPGCRTELNVYTDSSFWTLLVVVVQNALVGYLVEQAYISEAMHNRIQIICFLAFWVGWAGHNVRFLWRIFSETLLSEEWVDEMPGKVWVEVSEHEVKGLKELKKRQEIDGQHKGEVSDLLYDSLAEGHREFSKEDLEHSHIVWDACIKVDAKWLRTAERLERHEDKGYIEYGKTKPRRWNKFVSWLMKQMRGANGEGRWRSQTRGTAMM